MIPAGTPGGEAADPRGGALDATVGLRLGTLELEVTVQAPAGTVVAVLGPNGSGKTTLLRALAGLVAIDRGVVRLDRRVLDDPASSTFVEPERRATGYVPQGLLLFPNLSVVDNVAFGLRSRGVRTSPARRTGAAWLERMGVADYAAAKPSVLSGGQAQRVALARALAVEPDLLLLDEPLSALDVATRAETRRNLRRHLDAYEGVTVLVTHDPLDALLLADEIVILEAGRVTQVGPVAEVAARPRTRYVADLIGTNLLRGRGGDQRVVLDGSDTVVVVGDVAPEDALVAISPSAVALHRTRPEGSVRNVWSVTVETVDLLGDRVRVGVEGPVRLVAEITPGGLAALDASAGDRIWASVKATEAHVYPA